MIALAALLFGCHHDYVGDTDAIVVMFTVDTLGQSMAKQTGWCERMQAITGDYGLDVACVDGAISPSSWTAEAHTRFLWPQNTVDARRYLQAPDCGENSVLGSIRDATGGTYIWGADNSVLSASDKDKCGDGRTQFTQGTDYEWETSTELEGLVAVPESDRPVHKAIDEFEKRVAKGGSVELFLNAIEPGGHRPRCWSDPTSEACQELFEVMVSVGMANEDDDRREKWLEPSFYDTLLQLVSVRRADEEQHWRPLFWATIDEQVRQTREAFFEDRLRRVLKATQDADRLGDLRLVVLGDHGENPCVARGLGDPTLNCGHNGITTEFTGFVPVFVAPASLAADWQEAELIGDGSRPWSTVNLAYGLVHDTDVPLPSTWGTMEPVGQATSWTCQGPSNAGGSGIHVEGDQSVRCQGGVCDTFSFDLPGDETYVPTEIVDPPASLAAYEGPPDFFTTACGG